MAKLSINENFFKNWTSEMSYILGFIVADGCILKRKNRKNSYIFNITNKEKHHLEKIKKAMSAAAPLGLKRSGYTKKKDCYFIQICNKEICKDLINLGILPRKTYNLNPIKVPDKYFSDFVRGFFDGDGTVYIYEVNKVSQIKAGFVSSSLSFITKFNEQLCENLSIPEKAIHQTTDKRTRRKMIQYNICFYIDDCEKLAEFMYRDNFTLYLPRKRRIFERWKSIKRRHYIKQNYPSKIGWRLNQKVPA